MKPNHFLALMEMAYWELPNSEIDPRLCGFLFAASEYYLSAYTATEQWEDTFEGADGHKGYYVFDEVDEDAGSAQLYATYEEYGDNWSPELRSGYEYGIRVIEQILESESLK